METTAATAYITLPSTCVVPMKLLSEENETIIPAINSFMGTTQVEGKVMYAVAAVVSTVAPLFVLILFFQRQIVSGLTAGAVKG